MNLISLKHGFRVEKPVEPVRKVQESRRICITLQSVAYLMGQTLYRHNTDRFSVYEILTNQYTHSTHIDLHSIFIHTHINNA